MIQFTNAPTVVHAPMKITAFRSSQVLASLIRRAIISTAAALLLVSFSARGYAQSYVFTNDDSFTNGVSFYTIGSGGGLTFSYEVPGPGLGIGGGFFGMIRLATLDSGNAQCIFASEAYTGDVFWIVPGSAAAAGSAPGSQSDVGSANGIALAANTQYLYAGFSSSSTIATFQVQSGCALTFVGDTAVAGLNGGFVDGMALHGNMLIASYADGSIQSFNIANGMPVSNGDEQDSTASVGGETYPNAIDITEDGHFAIFGDTSTADVVEVSDISSGKLTPTVVYQTHAGINSSNILLSPDESVLYISNTQGAVVTAVFFNKSTGQITRGCTSPPLKNYVQGWQYLGSLALQEITGNGGGVYVAEFGTPSGIATVNLTVHGSACTLEEADASPTPDEYSQGLLSIGRFPPRSF